MKITRHKTSFQPILVEKLVSSHVKTHVPKCFVKQDQTSLEWNHLGLQFLSNKERVERVSGLEFFVVVIVVECWRKGEFEELGFGEVRKWKGERFFGLVKVRKLQAKG